MGKAGGKKPTERGGVRGVVPLFDVTEETMSAFLGGGYKWTTLKAVGETAIARVIDGHVDEDRLATAKMRIQNGVKNAGHDKVSLRNVL